MLLVGAIVLAFVIIALVPVFNGVFAPDSAGSNEPPEVGDGPATLRAEQASAARELAVRIGHGDTHASASAVAAELLAALANYTRVSAESVAEQRGWYVETRLNASSPGTVEGERLVQRDPGRLTPPSGNAAWNVVPPGKRTELGWFVLRLDTSNLTAGEPLVVEVANTSTDTTTVSIERQENSDGVELSVGGPFETTDEPVVCDATNGQVVLDLYRGRSADRDCAFPALRGLEGPVDIRVENPTGAPDERAVGVYDLVVRDPSALPPTFEACTEPSAVPTEPCTTPVLWQLSLETTVDGGRATYTTARNVTVYGGGAR